ncbi:hypothetical protein J2128_002219 [Methanomicrobium sp. W14]|uniref:DUF3821 domain-containing protein n=1 Tax=Methanomicrobium sp. W14 TaxID=2817839 RepID=UPI001FD92800|nr:DUF3821 domain-containing protein [Methanomicrobium sp. W14]MBP2134253.1 hypothetical protein [Methanomicrobium sp. W14]
MKRKLFIVFFALICTAFILYPASAALNQINKGDTVFLGEQGLVLNSDVFYTSGNETDTQLAYYSSGNPATDSPSYTITPDKNSFIVSQADFSGREGIWYSYPDGAKNGYSAINVVYPNIAMKIYSYRPGGESFDITGGKIVSGEMLDFRLDSNLYPIFSRDGATSSDGGIDIIVEDKDGATFSSLYNCQGTPVSIKGVQPENSAYFLPSGTLTCLWDTGNSLYSSGEYTIWAECDVNGILDNLGRITGATVSSPVGTVQESETLDTGITQTQTPTPTPVVTPVSQITQTPKRTLTATKTPTTQVTETTQAKTQSPAETSASPETTQSPAGIISVLFALGLAGVYLSYRKE